MTPSTHALLQAFASYTEGNGKEYGLPGPFPNNLCGDAQERAAPDPVYRYGPAPLFTEQMLDVLREGRFRTEPGVQHVLAMDLMAQEASLAVWIAGDTGVRSARDIAHDAIARNRHQALVRSYEVRASERAWAAKVEAARLAREAGLRVIEGDRAEAA